MTPHTQAEALADLLKRVEGASGPDRSLDVEIALATCPELMRADPSFGSGVVWTPCRDLPGRDDIAEVDTLTASVDAALALVERVRPGWKWGVGSNTEDWPFIANLWPPDHGVFFSEAATPALALLAALLRSLQP